MPVYSMYGTAVQVDHPLPLSASAQPPDITISRVDQSPRMLSTAVLHDVPAPEVGGRLTVTSTPSGLRIQYGDSTAIWYRDQSHVAIAGLNTPPDPATLIPLLERLVLPIVLLDSGPWLALHGSAVVFDGRAWVLLGPSGHGKSTLALALLADGASLASDDVTMVDDALRVVPGMAVVRTRTADLTSANATYPLTGRGKYLHLLAPELAAGEPAPMGGLLALTGEAAAPPRVLTGSRKMSMLLANQLVFQNRRSTDREARFHHAGRLARAEIPLLEIGRRPNARLVLDVLRGEL